MSTASTPSAAFFVTCLVDMFRPSVAHAALRLLRKSGFEAAVPLAQTCCGQPAYNTGDHESARRIAKQVIEHFQAYRYVVLPSGSCAAMIKQHYVELFSDDAGMRTYAQDLAQRTYELSTFLSEKAPDLRIESACSQRVTYHDGCTGLRSLGVKAQPRSLLSRVKGLQLIETPEKEPCCGFGGSFCAKYPNIALSIADRKIGNIEETGANLVITGELGCLLHLESRIQHEKKPITLLHYAELLAPESPLTHNSQPNVDLSVEPKLR